MLAAQIGEAAPGTAPSCAKVAKKREKQWKGKDRLEVC